jgi:intein/homing endonuclease
MRTPRWIFNSSKNVKIAYLKEAFDMEGTILRNLKEIRFVSKDKEFVEDIKRLLSSLSINASITYAPRYNQKSGQYRVSVYGKSKFIKFKLIGFGIPFLNKRFKQLLEKYKI